MAYPLFTSSNPQSVRFGNGLALRPANGGWVVDGGKGEVELNERESWRAVALLEYPLDVVRSALAQIEGPDFPLLRVVNAGLTMSQAWAELALKWVAGLSHQELQELGPALSKLQETSWSTQQMRHAARKAIRRDRMQQER